MKIKEVAGCVFSRLLIIEDKQQTWRIFTLNLGELPYAGKTLDE
jgi:hypothetical protein